MQKYIPEQLNRLAYGYHNITEVKEAMKTAKEADIPLYDLARDYGLGKAQKMIGEFGTKDIIISAKYTPFTHYKPGCVRKSLEKDLKDFKRDYVDIYWLHLPTDIEEHLSEIIDLYYEGKIKYVSSTESKIGGAMKRADVALTDGIKARLSATKRQLEDSYKKLSSNENVYAREEERMGNILNTFAQALSEMSVLTTGEALSVDEIKELGSASIE